MVLVVSDCPNLRGTPLYGLCHVVIEYKTDGIVGVSIGRLGGAAELRSRQVVLVRTLIFQRFSFGRN